MRLQSLLLTMLWFTSSNAGWLDNAGSFDALIPRLSPCKIIEIVFTYPFMVTLASFQHCI